MNCDFDRIYLYCTGICLLIACSCQLGICMLVFMNDMLASATSSFLKMRYSLRLTITFIVRFFEQIRNFLKGFAMSQLIKVCLSSLKKLDIADRLY